MDTKAQELVNLRHHEGVELSSLGYFEHADAALYEASAVARTIAGAPARIQTGAIHRDLALNALRQGRWGAARTHINTSTDLLDKYYAHIDEGVLLAERGATVTTRARLATARDQREYAARLYSRAHRILKWGNNKYYLTNNDILAAREARIADRRLAALGWAAVAAGGVIKAALSDIRNFKQAAGTFACRLPDTFSKSRAIASLTRTRPILGRIFSV